MESVAQGFRAVLSDLETEKDPKHALLVFTKRVEGEYKGAKDINLFVFSLRCFFCWHKVCELVTQPDTIQEIREVWVRQNEKVYSDWLSSVNDSAEDLLWEKWTFQAKMAVLAEFLEIQGSRCTGLPGCS